MPKGRTALPPSARRRLAAAVPEDHPLREPSRLVNEGSHGTCRARRRRLGPDGSGDRVHLRCLIMTFTAPPWPSPGRHCCVDAAQRQTRFLLLAQQVLERLATAVGMGLAGVVRAGRSPVSADLFIHARNSLPRLRVRWQYGAVIDPRRRQWGGQQRRTSSALAAAPARRAAHRTLGRRKELKAYTSGFFHRSWTSPMQENR